MRSYNAWRRELVGVCGTVLASGPRWCTGVEGTESSDSVGVSSPDNDGVRNLVGVRRSSSLFVAEWREDVVFGKRMRLLEGHPSTKATRKKNYSKIDISV